MARDFVIRIGARSPDGRHSKVWRIFSVKDEVYALHRTSASAEKISFHSSRICRRAFVSGHPLPAGLNDRVLQRWTRAPTQPAGTEGAVKVLTIIFPQAHLSGGPETTKRVTWLVAPTSPNMAACAMLIYTNDSEGDVRALFARHGSALVAYHGLPNGEAIAILSYDHSLLLATALGVGDPTDPMVVVMPNYPTPAVARTTKVTLMNQPDELVCVELTGFKLGRQAAEQMYPDADRLERVQVIDRRGSIFR